MIKEFLKKRLREASTWRAIIGFVTIFGISLTPEQKETIAVAGASLICVIGAFFPDTVPKTVETVPPIPEPQLPPEPDALGDGELKWNGKTPGSFP